MGWAIFFHPFRPAIDRVFVRNLAGGKRRRYQYQLFFALLVHFAYDAIILHFPEEFRPFVSAKKFCNITSRNFPKLKRSVGHTHIVENNNNNNNSDLKEPCTIVSISFKRNETFCWKPIFVAHYRYICLIPKKNIKNFT